MTPSIKDEFEKAYRETFGYKTVSIKATWAAHWTAERCAKEADKFHSPLSEAPQFVAGQLRQLAKEFE